MVGMRLRLILLVILYSEQIPLKKWKSRTARTSPERLHKKFEALGAAFLIRTVPNSLKLLAHYSSFNISNQGSDRVSMNCNC